MAGYTLLKLWLYQKNGVQWRETEGLVGKDKIDLKIQTAFSNTHIHRP